MFSQINLNLGFHDSVLFILQFFNVTARYPHTRLSSHKLSTVFIHNNVNNVNNLDKLSHMNYFLSTMTFR
jgi:hypothetical protein